MATGIKAWSPTYGVGMLDYGPRQVVFAPDGGAAPITIAWTHSRTGQAAKKSEPRRKADRGEWWQWLTFTTGAGEVFLFRRNGPTPTS